MITKIFEEPNLENYTEIVYPPFSDFGQHKFAVPVISGIEFTKTVSANSNNSGSESADYGMFSQGTAYATGIPAAVPLTNLQLFADLNLSQIPIIPIDARIHVVRISFDWILSIAAHAQTSAPGALHAAGFNGESFAEIWSMGPLGGICIAALPRLGQHPNCTGNIADISFSDNGTAEVENDYGAEGLSYVDFLSIYNPVIIIFRHSLGAHGQQCFAGGVLKTMSLALLMSISNWRMEVDYEFVSPSTEIIIISDAGLSFDGFGLNIIEITGDAGLEFDCTSIIAIDPTVIIDTGADVGGLEFGGTAGFVSNQIIFAGVGGLLFDPSMHQFVLSKDSSGLYTFIIGQHFDKILSRNTSTNEVQDVKIPNPQGKTGFFGM